MIFEVDKYFLQMRLQKQLKEVGMQKLKNIEADIEKLKTKIPKD